MVGGAKAENPSRPLRIAHVTATFPPYWGGTGNVAYHNALALARRGHDVTVFTANYPRRDRDDEYPKEITVRRLPVLFRFGNAPVLPTLWGIAGYDIVHLHYPFYFGCEIVFLKSLTSHLPYVVTYHQDVLFPGLLCSIEKIHRRWLGQHVLTRAKTVLATSWDYAQSSRLRDVMQTGATIVAELPNGVDSQRFHPEVDGHGLRAQHNLQPSDRVLLFVGALDRAHYFKGVGILLDALARLADPDVRLLLVGDGDLRPRYQEKAIRLGLGSQVVFCGHVSAALLPAYYALCDLLVLPSTTMGEAFGVVLLEAMAAGKPVVASNLPGVRSVVSDGTDGLLAKPGDPADVADQIRILLNDSALRTRMGAAGRRKVAERYDWHAIGERLERLYWAVVG